MRKAKFLLNTALVLGLAMVACGPTPTPEVVKEVVKETVMVEKVVEVELDQLEVESITIETPFFASRDVVDYLQETLEEVPEPPKECHLEYVWDVDERGWHCVGECPDDEVCALKLRKEDKKLILFCKCEKYEGE